MGSGTVNCIVVHIVVSNIFSENLISITNQCELKTLLIWSEEAGQEKIVLISHVINFRLKESDVFSTFLCSI